MSPDDTEDALTGLRETLAAARGAEHSEDRANYLGAALGTALELREQDAPLSGALFDRVAVAYAAPDDAQAAIDGALELCDRAEGLADDDAIDDDHTTHSGDNPLGDRPPAGVEWFDEDHAVVRVELTRPAIEWIDVETGPGQGVDDWLRQQVFIALTAGFRADYGEDVTVSADVSEGFAQRASWLAAHERIEGREPDVAAIATSHLGAGWEWSIEGEPWAAAGRGP